MVKITSLKILFFDSSWVSVFKFGHSNMHNLHLNGIFPLDYCIIVFGNYRISILNSILSTDQRFASIESF